MEQMSYVWSTLYVPTMSITWLAERGIGVLRSLVTASLPQDIFFLLYFISFIYLGVGVLRSSVEYLCHKIVYSQSTFFTPHHPDQIGVDYYLLRARLAFICNRPFKDETLLSPDYSWYFLIYYIFFFMGIIITRRRGMSTIKYVLANITCMTIPNILNYFNMGCQNQP